MFELYARFFNVVHASVLSNCIYLWIVFTNNQYISERPFVSKIIFPLISILKKKIFPLILNFDNFTFYRWNWIQK